MGAGRAECGWSQNCALLSIPGNDRVRQSKREGGGRQTGREGDSLHSYRTLRGLERASSPSRLFAPREIQSRMNFFQRSVISWEREAGRGKDRGRGQIKSAIHQTFQKTILSETPATGLGQIKVTRTFLAWIISNLTKPAGVYCHCRCCCSCCCSFSMQNLSQSHASGPQSRGLLTKAAGGGYSSLPRCLIRCEGTRPVGGSERNTHELRWFQTAPLHHNTNGSVSSVTVDEKGHLWSNLLLHFCGMLHF